MKKLLIYALTLCMLFTASAYAGSDEELPECSAVFAEDTEVLCKIPFGTGENDMSSSYRDPELGHVCSSFAISDDGTVFILNAPAPDPAVFAYSLDGEFQYKISCDDMAQPEQPQSDNFCPIADITYYDGCLYAIARYNTETPALVKYSLQDKHSEKIRIPEEFLKIDEYANFEYIFATEDNIVLVTSLDSYLSYSIKDSSFLNESVVSVKDIDEKSIEIDLCGEKYPVNAQELMGIRVLGKDADGNIITWRSYRTHGGTFISDKSGKTVGRLSASVDSCLYTTIRFIGKDVYHMVEDTDNIYICKTGANADYIATGVYDISGDGKVTTEDAVILLRYCADMISDPFDRTFIKADANADGIANTEDAVTVLKVVAGMIND